MRKNIIGGIYRILNKINGGFYIGSAICFVDRKRDHFRDLEKNKHYNLHLQRAYNKYGADAFVFEILESYESPTTQELHDWEQWYLDNVLHTYNILKKAKGIHKGHKASEETKRRMSEWWNKPENKEQVENIRKSRLGKLNNFFGKHHSNDTRKKLSIISSRQIGDKNPFFGKKHSEEYKEKMSIIHSNVSKETKLKMSNNSARRGKPGTFLGKKHTASAKLKLSEARSKNLTYNGKTQNQKSWAMELGISPHTITNRLKMGLKIEDVLRGK